MELKDLFIGKIVKYIKYDLPVVIRDIAFNSTAETIAIVSFPTLEAIHEEVRAMFIEECLNNDAQRLYSVDAVFTEIDIKRCPVHISCLKEL